MYKLIVDGGRLKDYFDMLRNYSIDPESLSGITYKLLRLYSRPVVSSIFGAPLVPVKMLVSVRTDRTNELIVPDNGKFYTDCTAEYPNEHPLDDTVMLAGKMFVDKYFDCGEDILKVIPRTAIYPVGACFIDHTFYVYINIGVDHTLKNESFFKLKDCHYEKIEDLTVGNALECQLKDSLAIVPNLNPEEVNE